MYAIFCSLVFCCFTLGRWSVKSRRAEPLVDLLREKALADRESNRIDAQSITGTGKSTEHDESYGSQAAAKES